jgi:hypothetical protein
VTPIPEAFEESYDTLKQWLGKWAGVFWVALVLATMLGFKLVGPGTEISELKLRLDSTETAQRKLMRQHEAIDARGDRFERWMCVKSSAKEMVLSGLKCDGLIPR